MARFKLNWTCPYCGRPQVATEANHAVIRSAIFVGHLNINDVGTKTIAFACLNELCSKLSLSITLHHRHYNSVTGQYDLDDEVMREWRLMPESFAHPQPDYIPGPIVESYYEACRIRDLSPKASATLARRCLQGMIRDFCKIAKGTLDAEIKELRSDIEQGDAPAGVTPESVDAIDQVRSIGNIGAHMEKDVNLIIDVEPGEAQALIELIEMLFGEWYVAREQRQKRLAHIAAIAEGKKAQLAEAKANATQDKDRIA